MNWRRTAASVAVVAMMGLVQCGGVDVHNPARPQNEPPAPRSLLSLEEPKDGELVFPPRATGRRDRPALGTHGTPKVEELAVEYPSTTEELVLHDGKTFVVGFNKPVDGAGVDVPAGAHVSLSPHVPFLARWTSERTLEVIAGGYLDPKKTFVATISGVTAVDGKTLAAPIVLDLRSAVGARVAGKEIGHVPETGAPRVVVVAADTYEVVPRPELAVLYDQPIGLDLARKLIHLLDNQGQNVAVTLRHAAADSFGGVHVDRRFVVVASPASPLTRGADYTLSAADSPAGDRGTPLTTSVHVAEALALTGLECAWYPQDGDVCEADGQTVRSNRPELHLTFNNPLGPRGKDLRARVKVTPFVRNLTVASDGWSGNGRVVLTGDFRPSTRYRVSIVDLHDTHGQRLNGPLAVTMDMESLGASVTMPEGLVALDDASTKKFTLTSRNVKEATLSFWKVEDNDVKAFRDALSRVEGGDVGTRTADVEVTVSIASKQDELVSTTVDLGKHLSTDASWLASVTPKTLSAGAKPAQYPAGSAASRAPIALIKPGDKDSLAVHVHSAPGATLVHVARLKGGAPVKGADVWLSDAAGSRVQTDDNGVALLGAATIDDSTAFVVADTKTERLMVPLGRPLVSSDEVFPDLARSGLDGALSSTDRVVLFTDRGIYRPGSTVYLKGTVFSASGVKLEPAAGETLRLRVLGPTGKEVCRASLVTSDMGGVGSSCKLPSNAMIGAHQVELARGEQTLDQVTVRVAEFETPRFKVDVEASVADGRLSGKVSAKYLFGTPMDGAWAEWQLARTAAPFPESAMIDAGLSFRARAHWWDEEASTERWTRTGEASLNGKGELAIDQEVDLTGTEGPQLLSLQADVADKSYRHVAGRTTVTLHPAASYAGLKIGSDWIKVGSDLPVDLGVIDTNGKAVVGQRVTARLLRVEWRHVDKRGPGGAVSTEWRRTETEVARCSQKSGASPVSCAIKVKNSGDYRVVATVDGKDGGSQMLWAWADGDTAAARAPEKGRTAQVSADKGRYAPGETAHVVVRNPYPKATAILTVERGGLLKHESKLVEGPAGQFDVSVEAAHAPQVHVTVTLLPMGVKGAAAASFRVGALTLPVKMEQAALGVSVASDKQRYEPGDTAEITVKVLDNGTPEPKAEVALAIVDEGVLRLTAFQSPNPVERLRPPVGLAFAVRDSRGSLAELFERSHVAGDGGGEIGDTPDTRRNFAETALWKPALRTDKTGTVKVRFKLPDNLTEFRMMAVVIDKEGKGAAARSTFLVQKPVMLDPVLPRFAHVGDQLELAAMVHNNSASKLEATVHIDGKAFAVSIPPGGRQRVGKTFRPETTGYRRIRMDVTTGGKVVDSVRHDLRVAQAGIAVHPTLSSAFSGEKDVTLAIPAEAQLDDKAELVVRLGENTWPELGARLEYLLEYPHGCVEQTTSSTLPILAAREILPRIGVDKHDDAFYRTRIQAGLTRLASMRTASGGLAYWPGDDEPNVYGTAYAMRAFVLARASGISPPADVLAGMQRYLKEHVLSESTGADTRAIIAQSLAELDDLPPGITDTLFARREHLSLFGKASLALALGKDEKQADRVATLVDEMEKTLGPKAMVVDSFADTGDYYGSADRTRAQATLALTGLRPRSEVLPKLVMDVARQPETYSTQSTAYSLVALAHHLKLTPAGEGATEVSLDGEPIAPAGATGEAAREFRIPLAELAGKRRTLRLRGGKGVTAFAMRASYRMPIVGGGDALPAASGEQGPDLYRVYTHASGSAVDLEHVRAGDLVRVAIMARIPRDKEMRRGYLAITDRLPAGFEPVDPDLATVATAPEISSEHPFADQLRYPQAAASHVELRDDRVQLYFDAVPEYADMVVATYLARATTPGSFAVPPATAELMYQPDSESYTDSTTVRIEAP